MNPETLPQRIRLVAQTFHHRPVQFAKAPEAKGEGAYITHTYQDFWTEIEQFGAGLLSLGIGKNSHVGIISDNRREWLVCDMAILGLGAADVPRGSDSTKDEVSYILNHGDCTAVIAEDQVQLEKILSGMPPKSPLKLIIVLDDSLKAHRKGPSSLRLVNYSEVTARGKLELQKDPKVFDRLVDQGQSGDLATIIYTSGTTGEPKGVMLTHLSFNFQIDRAQEILLINQEDVFLSVLPIWHAYERAIEYIVLGSAASIAYSKPVGKIMLEDMAAIKPTYFISVPRIWESIRSAIYRNVRNQNIVKQSMFNFFVSVGGTFADIRDKFLGRWPRFHPHWNLPTRIWTFFPLLVLYPLKIIGDLLLFRRLRNLLGGRFVCGISGGGALPGHVDHFFRALGILVLEGYGLTECGPVLGVRLQRSPTPKTIGPLFRQVQMKVVDEETGKEKGPGEKGELWVKTPQIMLGYYKKPDLTSKVIKDGWLNTGDLVITTVKREVRIIGRSKDTIVLRGGENIEPEPIEQKLLQSEFIEQVMVVGQDQKYLGALIVPHFDLLEKLARERRITYLDREELLDNAQVMEYLHETIQYLVNPRTGFKAFERVFKFKMLPRPFTVGVEMTQSLKLKRNVISEVFQKEIASLFDQKED